MSGRAAEDARGRHRLIPPAQCLRSLQDHHIRLPREMACMRATTTDTLLRDIAHSHKIDNQVGKNEGGEAALYRCLQPGSRWAGAQASHSIQTVIRAHDGARHRLRSAGVGKEESRRETVNIGAEETKIVYRRWKPQNHRLDQHIGTTSSCLLMLPIKPRITTLGNRLTNEGTSRCTDELKRFRIASAV